METSELLVSAVFRLLLSSSFSLPVPLEDCRKHYEDPEECRGNAQGIHFGDCMKMIVSAKDFGGLREF